MRLLRCFVSAVVLSSLLGCGGGGDAGPSGIGANPSGTFDAGSLEASTAARPACRKPGTCECPILVPEGATFTDDGRTKGRNALGTSECANTIGSPEVVYLLQSSVGRNIEAHTCSGITNFDTVLSVRQGSCAGPEVACNDGACGTTSDVFWFAQAGEQYYVIVDGANGAKGAFTLRVFFN